MKINFNSGEGVPGTFIYPGRLFDADGVEVGQDEKIAAADLDTGLCYSYGKLNEQLAISDDGDCLRYIVTYKAPLTLRGRDGREWKGKTQSLMGVLREYQEGTYRHIQIPLGSPSKEGNSTTLPKSEWIGELPPPLNHSDFEFPAKRHLEQLKNYQPTPEDSPQVYGEPRMKSVMDSLFALRAIEEAHRQRMREFTLREVKPDLKAAEELERKILGLDESADEPIIVDAQIPK